MFPRCQRVKNYINQLVNCQRFVLEEVKRLGFRSQKEVLWSKIIDPQEQGRQNNKETDSYMHRQHAGKMRQHSSDGFYFLCETMPSGNSKEEEGGIAYLRKEENT